MRRRVERRRIEVPGEEERQWISTGFTIALPMRLLDPSLSTQLLDFYRTR